MHLVTHTFLVARGLEYPDRIVGMKRRDVNPLILSRVAGVLPNRSKQQETLKVCSL